MNAQDQTSRAAPLTVGLVLAGGLSRRFSDEKAAALLHGRPLLLWAASALRPVCDEIAVSALAGVALLAAISAPTALAIRKAEAANLTLIALARADGHTVFSGAERLASV